MNNEQSLVRTTTSSLGEILERVLDKGVVIAGDIKIELAEIELLTIKIRLLVASVDKAKAIGIDWWEKDSYLSSRALTSSSAKSSRQLESGRKKPKKSRRK